MPSTTDELREKMNEYFGDPISDQGPTNYLISKGYKQGRDWIWRKPDITIETMDEKDFNCILFLVEEWDEGWFWPYTEETCPGHAATPGRTNVCVHCGITSQSMR